MIKIYCLRCPKTNEPKYVGRTKDVKLRMRNHSNRFHGIDTKRRDWINSLREENLKPILEVLKEVDESEGAYWEKFYLLEFTNRGYSLMNQNINNLGNQTSFKSGFNSVEVVALDKLGNYVFEFASVKGAEKFVNTIGIGSVLLGITKTCAGYIWLKKVEYIKMSEDDIKAIVFRANDRSLVKGSSTSFKKGRVGWNKGVKGLTTKSAKTIYQYSLNGEFIKTWRSAKEAGNTLNIHPEGIARCARGIAKSAGSFYWSYELK